MPTTVPQSQIPLLPLLYHLRRLVAAPRPRKPASALLNSKIGLIRTDITTINAPNGAIVNAANSALANGGGVCGAIHTAAGWELLKECIQLNGCETGDAKITKAYNLPCKNVIHAVGPIYWKARKTNEHALLLSSCYTASLKLAVENGLDTIVFPAVSTGVYGYPSNEAAETAISTVRDFLETEEGKRLGLVVFCNFEAKDEMAYLELLPEFFPPPDKESPENAGSKPVSGGTKPPGSTETGAATSSESIDLEQANALSVEGASGQLEDPHTVGGDDDDGFVVVDKDGHEEGAEK